MGLWVMGTHEAELASLEDGTTVLRPSDSKPHPASGDGLFGTLSLRGVRMMREVGAELRRTCPSLLHKDLPLSADDVRVHCTDCGPAFDTIRSGGLTRTSADVSVPRLAGFSPDHLITHTHCLCIALRKLPPSIHHHGAWS